METPILSIEGFSKAFRSYWTFRPIQAVKNVSLEVTRGESFGYLGHNGAGKTTTIKSLLGLIRKTSGEFYLDGKKLTSAEQHRAIGYLPEQPYFYDHLTVEETLNFFATLFDMTGAERKHRVKEVLAMVNLGDRKKSSVRSLSKGLQQRLAFGQAIINRPKLLLLDEPFSGLDPLGRKDIRSLIFNLNQQGTTIFLSSHILSDVEDICDRVSIMARGELKTVFHLKDTPELFGETFELTIKGLEEGSAVYQTLAREASEVKEKQTTLGTFFEFRYPEYAQAERGMKAANDAALQIDSFRSSALSLEDVFVNITAAEHPPNNGASTKPERVEAKGARVR